MSESQLQTEIRKALKSRGIWCVKIHGGTMQRAGLPDLLCIVLGRAVFLEVKLPGGQLTKLQKHTIDELRKHGAISGVVRSVDEALMMVGPLLTVSP